MRPFGGASVGVDVVVSAGCFWWFCWGSFHSHCVCDYHPGRVGCHRPHRCCWRVLSRSASSSVALAIGVAAVEQGWVDVARGVPGGFTTS